jgi:hypothetical protein
MVIGSVLIPIEYSGSSPLNQVQALLPSDDHISVEGAAPVTVGEAALPQAVRNETNKMSAKQTVLFLSIQ